MEFKIVEVNTINVGCSFCKQTDIDESNRQHLKEDNKITITYDVKCNDCNSNGIIEENWLNKNKSEFKTFNAVLKEGTTFYCPYCDSPDLKLSALKEGKDGEFFISKYKLKCACGGTANITEKWKDHIIKKCESNSDECTFSDKDYDGEIVVITGVQGSGKSTLYENKFKDTHVRVNLDTLKTRKKEDKLIEECIKNHKSFIIDNTNVTVENREKYINIAKQNNYKIVSYYIPTTKDIAIARNNLREGTAHVAKVVIYTALKKLVEPSKSEGFDELYIVDNSSNDYIITLK